ncbi:MAG: hypothetical protein WC708_04695 [Lentisphaeria bacterium]
MRDYGDRLQQAYSGIVFDVMRSLGHPDCILPRTLRPLLPGKRMAGRVFTVNGRSAPELGVGRENLVRKAILAGVDPVDAYLKYGKF